MSARQGVLLVGGNGFLGRALAKALAADGHEVHILSRHAEPGSREGIAFHRGSQDDSTVVPALLRICDTVVHLASTTTPGSSARHPMVEAQENLLPAARLAELMTQTPPRRLLFVSSGGSIYGNPVRIPVDETEHAQPLSYHAAGKLSLESLFSVFAHANEASLAIARPSNLYGPGQTLRHGFGLIRTLMERALRDESVEVWGDGKALRDYLFIDDAVAGCLSLIVGASARGVFNVGSGRGTSIREMIELVETVTDRRLPIVNRHARGTDVRAIVLNSSLLTETTGWRAQTPLEAGLRKTWDWMNGASK